MEKSRIKQILLDQKEELLLTRGDLKTRHQSALLQEMLSSKLVKVIMGVRRSGKSSLCQGLMNTVNISYVNFDDERFAFLETKDLDNIYQILKELDPEHMFIFLDEIQNVDKWELFINRLQRRKENIILTGSNGKLLSGDLATHLTGRQLSLNLYPLSFPEFLNWKKLSPPKELELITSNIRAQLSSAFEEFFKLGGFPEVIDGENLVFYLQELFDKIISKDIAQRYKLREVKSLKELAAYLILNSSQIVSLETLKKSFKIKSVSTVNKYLQFLMDAYLIFELRAYSFKLKERSTAPRKIYAIDLGMMKALWSKPTQDFGARLETLIFLELIKSGHEVYYLHQDQMEIDFCIVKHGKIQGFIQVCYDLSHPKTFDRELRSLVHLGGKHKVKNLFIVTRDENKEISLDRILVQVVPAYEFCQYFINQKYVYNLI